jgi:hypothetical protein
LKLKIYRALLGSELAAALAILSAACSVPLAPGYSILEERRDIQFTPGASPKVRIRAEYVLRNTGTVPLTFVDVKLPSERRYGRENARVEAGGHRVTFEELPEEYRRDSPDSWRIPLLEPLGKKGKLRLAIEYALGDAADPGWRVTIGANNFHLGSQGWSAVLEPPRHALSPFPKSPKKLAYTVRVPAGFLVRARGTLRGRQESDGEWIYNYELEKDDLPMYVVAGKYDESPREADESSPIFWTQSALAENAAVSQKELEQAWETMKMEFGPVDPDRAAPLIVESPELRAGDNVEDGVAAGFPGGALASPSLFAKGVGSREFLDEVSLALAHDWFGDQIYTPDFAAISMGEGLPKYASIVMAEARDGEVGRQRRIQEYLAQYDAACKEGTEVPLGVVRADDSAEAKRIAGAKAPLFYAALEDADGKEPVRAGLREMVTLLRGQEAGIDVLRSSLEQSTGKDLAPIFRLWLYQKGIPADFRARYSPEFTTPRAL